MASRSTRSTKKPKKSATKKSGTTRPATKKATRPAGVEKRTKSSHPAKPSSTSTRASRARDRAKLKEDRQPEQESEPNSPAAFQEEDAARVRTPEPNDAPAVRERNSPIQQAPVSPVAGEGGADNLNLNEGDDQVPLQREGRADWDTDAPEAYWFVSGAIENDIEVSSDKGEDRIVASCRVHRDPSFAARLGYHFRLEYVERPETEAEHFGYIQAWRIDKPTAQQQGEVPDAWRSSFLTKKSITNPAVEETCWCLQALYTTSGLVKPAAHIHQAGLADNALMFVQMIYISQKFQGRGLLRPSFNVFMDTLRKLPPYFAFTNGNLVLVPGRPEGVRGESWGATTDEDVEDQLRIIYDKLGFEVWSDKTKVREYFITVMGMVVEG